MADVEQIKSLSEARVTGIQIKAPIVAPQGNTAFVAEPVSLRFPSEIRQRIEVGAAQSAMQRFFKRVLDVVLAGAALFVLSPAVFVIAVLIKRDSEGGVLFSQTRVGKGGRLFKLYKFRTMVSNAEALKQELMKYNETDGPAFKMKADPRITKIGAFLRKTSLDELPQLWNVLIGDMSLVGPRPALPSEVMQWESWQFGRLSVEQGCTCIWQVSGRSNTTFEQWMKMDLEYVSNWSLMLDISLMIRTVIVMLTGRGAY